MKLLKKKLSAPIRASIWFMIASVLQQSVNLITTPIFTRILSESDFGITNVYQSWFNILNVIITLSLTSGIYNTAMIEFNEEIDKFTSSMIALTTTTSIIAFIIYVIFKPQIESVINMPSILIDIMFLNILLSPAMGFWMARQRFNYKYKLSILISIFITISGALLSYIFVLNIFDNKAVGKIFGSTISTIIVSLVLYILLLFKGRTLYNKKYWRYALVFSLPLIPHYLSGVVLAQSDRILIANMVGNKQAGLYGVAYSASNVISILWTAINASMIPWTFINIEKNNYEQIRKVTNYIIIICVFACLGFVTFAPEIIKVLAAPNYYEAVWVMPPIILGAYFTFLYGVFANIEFYHKRTSYIMIASISAAVANIVLNIIFIPIFGYIAAAYTTLIGYIALSYLHYIFMLKIEKNKIYDIKFIVIISIVLIIVSFIIMGLYSYPFIRYIIILILLIIVVTNKRKVINLFKSFKNVA